MKETKRPKKARSKRRKVSREKRERILEKTLKQTEYSERSEKEQAQIKRRISGEQQREKEIQRAPKNKVKISRISTKRSELQSIRERRGGKSCLNWVFPYLQLRRPGTPASLLWSLETTTQRTNTSHARKFENNKRDFRMRVQCKVRKKISNS